jgi:hypothetical protein
VEDLFERAKRLQREEFFRLVSLLEQENVRLANGT